MPAPKAQHVIELTDWQRRQFSHFLLRAMNMREKYLNYNERGIFTEPKPMAYEALLSEFVDMILTYYDRNSAEKGV